MTGSACPWDVDGVEVSPIQQRAVLRDLRRALVDPQFDGVVLARATKPNVWEEGYNSAVECVDARVEHLTGHIEGLAEAVPPVQSVPASSDLAEAVARLREQIDVCEAEGTGGCVMETPRDGARQMAVDLRLVLASLPATTPGDDRGRELDEPVHVDDRAGGTWARFLRHLDYVAEQNIGAAGTVPRDRLGKVQAAWAADVRRALAAPAETEAGDDDLAELIGELRDDSENLGTLALNAEGEHNYHDAMLLRGIGMDVDRAVARLAATPPAQGPAETGVSEPRWEYRLDALLTDGVHGFRCPLCGEESEATLDEIESYDRVKGHLLSHDPTLLAGALVEARSWARHGYEIGQRSATWSDHGVAPAWLTEGHDPAALAAPAETEAVIEAFARHRHEATGRDIHNGRNIRPDGDARGASPIGLCTWAEAPEDWREGYRELCRHDARLAATSPAPEGEAGDRREIAPDSREAVDHPCAECVPCGPGCAGHWTVPDRCQPAATPPAPGEGQGATEGGALGLVWRVGDIGEERAERLYVPRWSVVGREFLDGLPTSPRVTLSLREGDALTAHALVARLNGSAAHGWCGEQWREGDHVWTCTEPLGHTKGGCQDQPAPAGPRAEGAGGSDGHSIRDRLAGDEGLTGDETLTVGPDAARSTPGGERS